MANIGVGPYSMKDIAAQYGIKTSLISRYRSSLVKKGLIYSNESNLIDFTVPLFSAFINRTLGE